MTTSRRILLAIAAVAACSLGATAATASADTYCVSDAACLAAGGTNAGGLQPALDQAKLHAGPDVVKIGAGTFAGGPYAYTDGNGANPVQIQGAGAGATTLTMPAVKSLTVLQMRSNGTVSDLKVAIPASSDIGIAMPDSGTARRVSVVASDPQLIGIAGVSLYGGTVDHSTIDLPRGSSVAVNTIDAFPVTLTDDTLSAAYGAQLQGASTVSKVQRVRVHAPIGIEVRCGRIDIEDSFFNIDTQGSSGAGVERMVDACGAGVANTVNVRQSTLVATSGSGTWGIYAWADFANQTTSISVTDSIIAGFTESLHRSAWDGGTANISTDHSAYDPSGDKENVGNGGLGAITESNRLSAAPAFASPGAGDYHLASGSPLIDAGTPGGLLAGESATDLDGAARVQNGRRDLGAFESTPPPPSAPAGTAPATTASTPATTSHAPKLSLRAAKRQKALRRKRVVVTALTDQPAGLRASGTIRLGHRKLSLRVASARASKAGKSVALSLGLRSTTAVRRALAHHRKVYVTVTVRATNAAGQRTTASRRIAITG